jgi:hypothetical protein
MDDWMLNYVGSPISGTHVTPCIVLSTPQNIRGAHGSSKERRQAKCDPRRRDLRIRERGLTVAPTSEISKRAGVAEGAQFTYFRTEED